MRFLLPTSGLSALDAPGMPFWDPEADTALFDPIEEEMREAGRVVRVAHHINVPEFAYAVLVAWQEVQA